METTDPYSPELKRIQRTIKRLYKRAKLRVDKQKQILADSLAFEKVRHTAVLLQANLFQIKGKMTQIVVQDWLQEGQEEKESKEQIILLDPLLKPHTQVAKLYKKAKKLQAAIPYAKVELEKAAQTLSFYEAAIKELDAISDQKTLEAFKIQYDLQEPLLPKIHTKGKELPPKPYREFFSKDGTPIWVGKSAKNNDIMTFKYANGSDFWLHAHDFAGSHVIIRPLQNQEISQETFAEAAELAMRYSQGRKAKDADVCLTQVKFLRRIKGAFGKVTLSSYKLLHVAR